MGAPQCGTQSLQLGDTTEQQAKAGQALASEGTVTRRTVRHSFCVPEVPGDKQEREEVAVCSSVSAPEEVGRARRSLSRMPPCPEKGGQADPNCPSDFHRGFICHHSFPRVVPPAFQGSCSFLASRCPLAQQPPRPGSCPA